jgi:uncharacterized membrane protein
VKKYILTGLLVWLPLVITIWVLKSVIGTLDDVFAWFIVVAQTVLPVSIHPVLADLQRVPGLSVIILVTALWLTGVAVTNMVGQWLLNQSNRMFSHIPIVKSIYNSVRQVSDTLFSSSGEAFRKAVLIQYPRAGSWTIAFMTGQPTRRSGQPPDRPHQRLCADHAQPDLGFLPDGAAWRGHRTRHDGGRSTQVHRVDGRRRHRPRKAPILNGNARARV